MLKSHARYTAEDRIKDLIEDNSQLLLVLNRFKIPFGFGNSTVKDVCSDNNIDCPTFLAVANLVSGRQYSGLAVSLPTLVSYLKEAHSYILDFILPGIKDTLITGVHSQKSNDVALLILRFFDEYMEEVRSHMAQEDGFIFPYIDRLLKGIPDPAFHIRDFASRHDSMTSRLNELKEIFLRHYALPNTNVLNQALFNIIACGEDLTSHCEIENRLLVPAVEELEYEVSILADRKEDSMRSDNTASPTRTDTLSDRERDIIRLVAYGLSNKEIADRLCLSFHTVTTYRKNISAKLDIHSTAGIVIFAILHKIVDMDEIIIK